jgi:hypothetical protein
MDVMKLMMSDWKVELVNDNISEFNVLFKGPTDSASPPAYGALPELVLRAAFAPESVSVKVSGIDPCSGLLPRANRPAICHLIGWTCCAALWCPHALATVMARRKVGQRRRAQRRFPLLNGLPTGRSLADPSTG